MLKQLFGLFLAVILASSVVRADEGMWLPLLIKRLNQQDLQKKGLQLTPEEIYSVNSSSLKDAIVSLGGFCTGEMVSSKGLMLTNHHCAYDAIQSHSTVENDYLTDGFWAANLSQELPNPGLYARFLVRMEDVTQQVLQNVTWDMDEATRAAAVSEAIKGLVDQTKGDTHYDVQVKEFFAGNEYYLFVYETFTDVRLVGAPPSSIGKFGGDTDNWMWPRQTGDFAMFRVYMGADGKPAPYSPENVPYKPKHHLPVSLEGVQEGDMTMTFGYPGSTDRYLTSFGIEQAIEKKNPAIVKIRDLKLATLREDMESSDALRILYASKYAQISNYWKYFIGQTEQLKRNKVYDRKKKLEAEFTQWVNADASRKEKYGDALKLIEEAYASLDATAVAQVYVLEAGLIGADAVLFSFRADRVLGDYFTVAAEEQEKKKSTALASAEAFFNESNLATDKKLFARTMAMFAKDVPTDQQPEFLREANSKYKGNFEKYAEKVYSTSIFTDKARMEAFLEKPNEKKYESDPMLAVSREIFGLYTGASAANGEAYEKLQRGERLFQAGLREMMPNKQFYPDANSTMRISFGEVKAYEPRDGVFYKHYTTLNGIVEKEDPKNDEFIVPSKLTALIEKGNFGRYADADGLLPVNFISTNDITGGNSGSPVINGKGELVGIAFDGNWEAMSGDISFETEVQRTISVDIRYVLFVIDKYAGAGHLVEEMDLVRREVSNPKQTAPEAPAAPVKEAMN